MMTTLGGRGFSAQFADAQRQAERARVPRVTIGVGNRCRCRPGAAYIRGPPVTLSGDRPAALANRRYHALADRTPVSASDRGASIHLLKRTCPFLSEQDASCP